MNSDTVEKKLLIRFVVLIPYVLMGIAVIYRGLLIGDEGFYVLASINILEGEKPYRDFLFTQTPFLPYFYGLFMFVFGKSLIVGRWVSFCLGIGTVITTMIICNRKGGPIAALLGGILLTFNLDFIFETSTVKTQSLTVFLTAMSLYFAVGKGKKGQIIGSLLCMNLAVLTRLSILPAIFLLWVFLILTFRNQLKNLIILMFVNIVLILSFFAYFYSDGNLLFGIYQFHTAYFGNLTWALERFWLFIKGFLSNQFVIILCFFGLSGLVIWNRLKTSTWSPIRKEHLLFTGLLFTIYVSTTLIHVTRPVSYPSYQTSNIVFAVIFSALILESLISTLNQKQRKIFYSTFILMLFLNMPFQWYKVYWNGDGSPERIKEAANYIKSISEINDSILTLSPELAFESGRSLLPGYEMSQFSYFPTLSNKRAKKLNVINTFRLQEDISKRKAKILCFTQRNLRGLLSISENRDLLKKFVRQNYVLRKTIPGYGQFLNNLYIFSVKKVYQS